MADTAAVVQDRTASDNRQDFGIDDLLQFQVVTLGNKLGLSILRRALAPNNLSIREWRVICVMFVFGPSMARQISEHTALDPAHVSRTLHQLKRRGIVTFHENPDDKRQIIVDLTSEGTELARIVLPQVTEIANSIREIFSDDEFSQLLGYLQRANDHVDHLMAAEPD
ncbi:MAG: MarR family winged helix-turn-helix transcriptional regulator [Minwuia sp.]|nr:MarR family winged helix-turn-helix transcriptional regulator [Minwuia sp.]